MAALNATKCVMIFTGNWLLLTAFWELFWNRFGLAFLYKEGSVFLPQQSKHHTLRIISNSKTKINVKCSHISSQYFLLSVCFMLWIWLIGISAPDVIGQSNHLNLVLRQSLENCTKTIQEQCQYHNKSSA